MIHNSAFLKSIVKYLNLKKDGIYIDCTFGCGGHSLEILKNLNNYGRLLSFDLDPKCSIFSKNILNNDSRFYYVNDNFINMIKYVNKFFNRKVDGVLFDLGISSYQLDDSYRGFSFMRNGPLDMRINQNIGFKASYWLNKASKNDIFKVIKDFGEEKYAMSISKKICIERKYKYINNTEHLSNLVKSVVKFNKFYKNQSTRTFQAIRIFINNELFNLKIALREAYKILSSKGRLVVISFHSLEDRIVKNFIKLNSNNVLSLLNKLPLTFNQINKLYPIKMLNLGKKKPNKKDILNNSRIRSSILRIAEKI